MDKRSIVGLLPLMALIGAAPATYDPRETFAPFDMKAPVNVYRGESGLPGPQYWQNRADNAIHATLDPAAHAISATIAITYTNNSPTTLDVLWLQLDQNIYKPGSRAAAARGGIGEGNTEGMVLDTISVELQGRPAVAVTPLVSDTRAATSDATVLIHGPDDIARAPGSGTRTWLFRMQDTRDVAWSASRDFVWDAARIRLPGGKASMAMSFYPLESQGNAKWG